MRNIKKLLAAVIVMSAVMPFCAYADIQNQTISIAATQSAYDNIAISQVTNYVNVRSEPRIGSEIVGKIYNNCAATILATVAGEDGDWYQIQSGNVYGYIKAEFFITGDDAEKIAKEIGTVYVTIDADDLRLRSEPNLESPVLTTLSKDDEYIEIGEEGEFFHIQVDADLDGYVHRDFCHERVEFRQAVSLEEEAAEREEADKRKQEADDAIALMEQLKSGVEDVGIIAANPEGEESEQETSAATEEESESAAELPDIPAASIVGNSDAGNSDTGNVADVGSTQGPGSYSSPTGSSVATGPGVTPIDSSNFETSELTTATRAAVVAYAKQFLGNPYVYGGTSLTEGADCSGFVMRVFEHFGIDTGRTSRDQAANGKRVAIDDVQPGDLIFYASGDYINHVAIYIGDGQIIHASTAATGIMISTMYYRTPYMAATFLD